MRSDPVIYTLIYPEIIRQVLSRAIQENIDLDEAGDRWPYLWLSFGKNLHPSHEIPPSPDDDESQEAWIEEVVSRFCELHCLRDKYSIATKRSEMTGD